MRQFYLPAILVLCAAFPESAAAQQTVRFSTRAEKSDQTALGEIFGDQHASEAALDVHRKALELPLEARFEFLSDWVLPDENHSNFRLHAGFTTLHPAPPTAESVESQGRRVNSGGDIVSPALDLIEAASSLGTLNELRQNIEAVSPASAEIQLDRLAMLCLVDMALGDLEAACNHLEAALALARPSADVIATGEGTWLPDAVLLTVHRASQKTETSKVAMAPAYQLTQAYLRVPERTAWQRHFTAAYNRAKQRVESEAAQPASTDSLGVSELWVPVMIPRARLRGAGAPATQWEWGDGEAEKLWSHDDDCLLYRIPLRGDLSVEGALRTFGWRETQMLVAGRWLGPFHTRRSYRTGTVGGPESFVQIEPPRLADMGKYFHYRTTVQDRVKTTYFNGRLIHEETLPDDHDPWIAIRSPLRSDSGVRDLRISGDPSVPETLLLSSSPELTGWNTYFSDPLNSPMNGIGRQWQFRPGSNQNAQIIGHRRAELPPGCHKESLLTYFRPLLEDGSVEYEFWYEAGQFHAHPALDRLCFLLDPEGVKIHWLTDGRYDQTELSPGNIVTEPANRRGPEQLPLKAGDWNRLRLTITGDTAGLELNDQLVYQRPLEATNQRVFGLFYYADRTGLRVRNVRWKGDWPRELPPVAEQELVSAEIKQIDQRLRELPAVFSHDFATDKLPSGRFVRLAGPQYINVQNDGVHVRRPGASGYPSSAIALQLQVGGDFDITAEFDQFVDEAPPSGKCTIMLAAVMDNDAEDRSILARRRIREGADKEERIVQCIRVFRQNGGVRRNYFAGQSVEAHAGQLRLARRGDRIYYLFAENDSGQFRILGEESYPADDLPPQGIRLMVQSHREGALTSVIWKRLTVHAEALSGPAMEDIDPMSKPADP